MFKGQRSNRRGYGGQAKVKGQRSMVNGSLNKGFTLIELLVVAMIIVLISTIGVASYRVANRNARDGKRRADLEQIRSALEIYRNDCGKYPDPLSFGYTLTGSGSPASCATGNTYMERVPQDPQSPDRSFFYSTSGNTYMLCAALESSPLDKPCVSQNCLGESCGSYDCNYWVCNP